MGKIVFLRHAESMWNSCRAPGVDSPLSETGRQQAAAVTGDFDTVIVSPLRRTRDTLTASKITYRRFLVSPCVREVVTDPGDTLDGETYQTEMINQVHDRIREFRALINALEKTDGRTLVVSHHDFLLILTGESFGCRGMMELDLSGR